MKRILTKEIESCSQCHFLECQDGYSSHSYLCIKNNFITNKIDDYESSKTAEKSIEEWFLKCQEWEKI